MTPRCATPLPPGYRGGFERRALAADLGSGEGGGGAWGAMPLRRGGFAPDQDPGGAQRSLRIAHSGGHSTGRLGHFASPISPGARTGPRSV